MWFFMNLCYFLTALSVVMIFVSGLQGYFQFKLFNANHPTFALLTMIIYLFTETLIIFFFVGTGVSIKEYILEKKLSADFHKRSLKIKMRVYPPLLLSILLFMILFISGGAVDTQHLPGWIHGTLFCVVLIHFLYAVHIQHQCFKENTQIVLEMSGVQ